MKLQLPSFISFIVTAVGMIGRVGLVNFNITFSLSLVLSSHSPDEPLCAAPTNTSTTLSHFLHTLLAGADMLEVFMGGLFGGGILCGLLLQLQIWALKIFVGLTFLGINSFKVSNILLFDICGGIQLFFRGGSSIFLVYQSIGVKKIGRQYHLRIL